MVILLLFHFLTAYSCITVGSHLLKEVPLLPLRDLHTSASPVPTDWDWVVLKILMYICFLPKTSCKHDRGTHSLHPYLLSICNSTRNSLKHDRSIEKKLNQLGGVSVVIELVIEQPCISHLLHTHVHWKQSRNTWWLINVSSCSKIMTLRSCAVPDKVLNP